MTSDARQRRFDPHGGNGPPEQVPGLVHDLAILDPGLEDPSPLPLGGRLHFACLFHSSFGYFYSLSQVFSET